MRLQLRQADFTTAARITAAINKAFGSASAKAENSALISVEAPASYANRPVEFVADVENLTVEADRLARIIINERTGTIALGNDVHISAVSVLHGSLTVQVETTFEVSQPNALGTGDTTVIPKTAVDAKEDKARNLSLKKGATVEELVRALKSIGSTPRDVIAILQSLKAAGAIEAELEVI
jgi:flagellar P-ring protein precursor FlgI